MDTNHNKQPQLTESDIPVQPSESNSDLLKSERTEEQMQSGQSESDHQASVHQASVHQEKDGYENSKEPTRYGDWEIAGRCVDF